MFKKNVNQFLLNRWVASLHDLICVPVAIFMAFYFRFNLHGLSEVYIRSFVNISLVSLPIYSFLFWYFGLYRGIWRFASLPDLFRIVKAVSLGFLAVPLVSVVLFKITDVPRTVIVLFPLLLVFFLIGSRLGYRLLKDRRLRLRREEGVRTLVVGAGKAGELLLRDLLTRQEFQPIAFVDDDVKKQGLEVHGIRVCGHLSDITTLVGTLEIGLVLLAIPSARKEIVNHVISECIAAGVEFKTLPSIHEESGNSVDVGQLRPITLDDLLGRESVDLDQHGIASYLQGQTVLVSGSGGSIGSELCRQVAALDPKRLVLFEHGEYNLYAIDHELRRDFPALEIITVLGDVKNRERVDWVFRKFRPQVIFHAAAYKHVPMLEINPAEGVRNNVMGTRLMAEVADQYDVECFVMVSTDKAVNPANVMGCTKRIAEIFCQNLARKSKTRFITTRFGNVLGSTGSVVPLFEKQIQQGGPVTVTHRDITRFFMTIPEAVSLILQAGSMGKGGEIYVLEMGEPILIRELAEQMIRLSGLVPEKDIKIVYTGLRPGEKLYEELFHKSENLQGTAHFKLQLAESRPVEWHWLMQELDKLELTAGRRDVDELLQHMQKIVPEYVRGTKG